MISMMFFILVTVLFVLIFINRFNSLHGDEVMEHHIDFQKQNRKWVLTISRKNTVFFDFPLSNEYAPVVLF